MLNMLTRGVVAAAIVGLAATLSAQPLQTGTISGTILDATGGALPGVTVTMTSQDRGFSRSTVTDENGRYFFPSVPIGPYRVVATLQGFETATATDNLVETDKETRVSFTLKIGALTDTVVVLGDTPLVTPTNTAANTRVRRQEFEKLPIGRSYQSLVGVAPGVVGTGNVNALGALTGNNLFIVDSVDTTDPTTGTFGTNLNFEAIQEVSIYTSGASAEYGRAVGAIVNVITKSGTNRFEGSAKYIFRNDDWDAQNSTKSEVTGASLERVKFDKVIPVYTVTGGGPVWRNRAWFFGAYEYTENTTPRRQTVGQIPEDYQQVTESPWSNVRGTVQLGAGHTAWVKYYRSPTDGFVIDYWGAAGEREALTSQNQIAKNWAAQYSGVLRDNWAVEAAFGDYSARIDVTTFEKSGRLGNAPIFSLAESKYYNGATFDGFVSRPRRQFNLASNWFLTPGGRSHDIKVGYDFQDVESGALFKYPNAQFYIANAYNQAAGTLVPGSRRDYEVGESVSTGQNHAVYVRDKLQLTDRLYTELGVRIERQTGSSDLGASTVATTVFAPRLSGSYDLAGDGKSLVTASYGRYHQGIIQGFSDAFAGVPQQQNYDNYVWDGTRYVFANSIRVGGSTFRPNTDLEPTHVDEFTVGFQRQFGRETSAGARFISRDWGNLIDDIRTFNADGSINRRVVNYEPARRDYRGLQFTFDRRFSNRWQAQGSYTYSRTRGNHFDNVFSPLGDYIDAQCRTTLDPTVGEGGLVSCLEVQEGANRFGRPIYDRPHNVKLNAGVVQAIGPVDVTVSGLTEFISKRRYQKERPVNVLRPGTLVNAGPTATYLYNQRGADQLPGIESFLDFATEVTWRVASTYQAGFKAEIFNLTNNQEKIISNNVAWCGTTANAACATAVTNFGKASARGSFLAPRTYRFSAIFRF